MSTNTDPRLSGSTSDSGSTSNSGKEQLAISQIASAKKQVKKIGVIDNMIGKGKHKRIVNAYRLSHKACYYYQQKQMYQQAGDIVFDIAYVATKNNINNVLRQQLYADAYNHYCQVHDISILDKLKICADQLEIIYHKERNYYALGIIVEKMADSFKEYKLFDKAIAKYDEAVQYYDIMGKLKDTYPKVKCTNKLISLLIMCKQFDTAYHHIVSLAQYCAFEELSDHKIKDLWLDAAICLFLMNNIIGIKNTLAKYCKKCPDYALSIDAKIIGQLIKYMESDSDESVGLIDISMPKYIQCIILNKFDNNSWQKNALAILTKDDPPVNKWI